MKTDKPSKSDVWYIVGSWSEGYRDVVLAFEQQEMEPVVYKSKFGAKDYYPHYQRFITGY